MKKYSLLTLMLVLGAGSAPLAGQPTFLSELPEVQLLETGDLDGLEGVVVDEVYVVRQIYQRAENLVHGSGYDLEIEISDVQTYYRKDFATVTREEMGSLPDGEVLALEVSFLETPRLEQPRAHIQPVWQEGQTIPPDSPEWTYNLQEAIEVGEAAGEGLGIVAVSSFAVRVAFEGKEKSYRAMLLWKHFEGEKGEFSVTDWVLQNLSMVLTVEDLPTPHSSVLEMEDSGRLDLEPDYIAPESGGGSAGVDGGCTANQWTYNQPVIVDSGQEEHTRGRHVANLELYGHCRCYSSCLTSCSPELNKRVCSDTGAIEAGRCHMPFNATRQAGDSDQNRAYCRGGLGCAIRSCSNCTSCDPLSFTFTLVSAGFDIQTQGGSVLREMNMSDRAACICQGPDDPPPDEGPCDPDTGSGV